MAVAAAVVGLASINSSSSSSCETASSAQSDATGAVDSGAAPALGSDAGADCGTEDVLTASAVAPAETGGEATPTTDEADDADHTEMDHSEMDLVVAVPAEATSTEPPPVTSATDDADPADPAPDTTDPAAAPAPAAAPGESDPGESDPVDPAPATADPNPVEPDPVDPTPPTTSNPTTTSSPTPNPASYEDITAFGVFHGSSSHTHGDSLAGGRTPITTEALVTYNGLRAFFGRDAVDMEAIGRWAFANELTNNGEAYAQDLRGVGLYYGMQGAKVGWIRDDAFDPQILADIQRAARQGDTGAVMTMVESFGHPGYAAYLTQSGLVDAFVNTLEMEPHYGGWMHGRVHGGLPFSDGTGASVATSHDLNHLTVLSHDQTQPFMNDTFDWPQWPALDVPEPDVIDYFQSMVVLSDPRGNTQL
ncbi:MAG: hypothetical protein AAFO29_02460 [Actinomycetota bacterium]